MYRSGKRSPNFFSIAALALLLATTLMLPQPALAATAKERPPIACDQPDDIGSVFYDFDTLIIWYVDFMRRAETEANFPEQLKYENFNANLLEAVKKNFALCLRTADGSEKPIVVIPPLQIKMPDKSEYDPKLIHDPKSLTILIRGDYALGPKGFGHVQFFIYRPEVSHKLARLPLSNNSTITVLPSQGGPEILNKRLESFFRRMKPMKKAEGHPNAIVDTPPWAIEAAKSLQVEE